MWHQKILCTPLGDYGGEEVEMLSPEGFQLLSAALFRRFKAFFVIEHEVRQLYSR